MLQIVLFITVSTFDNHGFYKSAVRLMANLVAKEYHASI